MLLDVQLVPPNYWAITE